MDSEERRLRNLVRDATIAEERAQLLAAFKGGYQYGVAETQGFTWGEIEDEFDAWLERRAEKAPSYAQPSGSPTGQP